MINEQVAVSASRLATPYAMVRRMAEGKPPRIRLSTEELSADQRLALWREGFVRRYLHMDFVNHTLHGLRFTVDLVSLGSLAAGVVHGTPAAFIRNPAEGNDDLLLVVNRQGAIAANLEGRRHDVPNGAAVLLGHRAGGEINYVEEGDAWFVKVARAALRHLLREADDTLVHIVPEHDSTLRLLVRYLEALLELDHIGDPRLAGVHVADLIATLVRGTSDAHPPLPGRDAPAARLAAVLDVINRRLAEPDLDPRRVADRLGFSVGYLHRLLRDTGRTFSRHLLERRLERAHRLLRDPRMAHLKISEISLSSGFSDLSHFNRSFRRRYGETPSAARAAAARKGPDAIEPPLKP